MARKLKATICKGFGDKLGKCKNQSLNPKKSPYCKNCAGNSFENQISRLFEVQGYEVKQNLSLSGTQHDFFASLQYGFSKFGVLVECKWKFDENDTVNSEDVRKFHGSWELYNKQGLYGHADKAYLITNAKFAPQAIEVSKNLNIELFSHYDLIKNLMNFEPYLQQLVRNFSKSDLANHYIEINSTNGLRISKELSMFLADDENEALVILGDYGAGKTSLMTKFCADLATKILSGSEAPIPIFIQLRDYEKAFDMEQLITSMLVNKCKIVNGNFNTFLELLELGYLILIFDGFDEVARRVDYSVKYKVFTEICRFATLKSKIIVTCRPNFFNQKDEFEKIFKSSPLHFEPNRRTVEFSEIEIAELTEEQIEKFISSYKDKLAEKGYKVKDFLEIMKEVHDLSDLAKRPVLLNVIIETMPKLLEEKGRRINAAMLYEKYTGYWLEREDSKGKTLIKAEQKQLFAEELAWKMFNKNKLSIHYKELPKEVQEYFKITSQDDINHFSHDIKSCSFLNNDDDEKGYKFIHKSFMEYFTAYHLLSTLQKNITSKNKTRDVNLLLGQTLITLEVGFFLRDLFESKNFDNDNIIKLLKGIELHSLSEISQKNVISIMAKTHENILPYILKLSSLDGVDLSCAVLKDGVISNKSLIGASFYGATIENIQFKSNCVLTNSIFRKSKLTNVSFKQLELETTDFNYSKIHNCNFNGACLAYSKFQYSHVHKTSFDTAEMTEVEINEHTKFIDCSFDSVLGIPYAIEQL